jgi:hypothetical protein
MRGLMADPQGQIISFPIRSNFREGLTLTEYFISCSGARKGLVDTALRTADTGYLTRRLVDVSHQVVIKRVACNTSRGIVLKALQSGPVGGSNKIMLSLKDRLIGRVLAEDIEVPNGGFERNEPETAPNSTAPPARIARPKGNLEPALLPTPSVAGSPRSIARIDNESEAGRQRGFLGEHPKKLEAERSSLVAQQLAELRSVGPKGPDFGRAPTKTSNFIQADYDLVDDQTLNRLPVQSYKLATRDSEISPNLASKIACLRDRVIVRSSLTCACTHEVCQLCYGWSLSQGKLVSLGEAVGVIAAQSIGEPGTQLTMRTFHTGGVFSGDLLQDIRAPHAGKVFFPQALQGLLVRTAQGQIAFLIKIPGALLLDDGKSQVTRIQLEAATMVFVRQGEVIESNTVIGELAVMTKEGNQPIKSRQTLFAEFGGRVTHHRGRTLKVHKSETDDEPLSGAIRWFDGEELDLVKDAEEGIDRLKNGFRFIEPTHSLSLGVFRILATRVGAKESHLSKVRFTEPKLRFSEPNQRPATARRAQVVERTAPLKFATLRSRVGSPMVGSTTKGSFANVQVAERSSVGPKGLEPSSLSFALHETKSSEVIRLPKATYPDEQSSTLVQKEPRLRSVRPFSPIYKLSGLGSNRSEVIGLIRNQWALATHEGVDGRVQIPPRQLTKSEAGRLLATRARHGFVKALFDKNSTTAGGRRDASAIDTFRPLRGQPEHSSGRIPFYVLNTIAEEGDLVDENYKDCTSSFQFTQSGLQNRTPTV